MQGNGSIIHVDAEMMYEGQFVYNRPHGKGRYIWGYYCEAYEGDFFDGVMDGIGTYYFASGTKYHGQWVNGKKQGKGKFIFANGDIYDGDIANDKMHGFGTFTFKNGL